MGDTIIYTPVAAKYRPDDAKTGDSRNVELATNESATWRVLSVNEKEGTIKVTTEGVANTGIYLKGETGYVKGPGELNTICEKLYSNTSKGITARSMTLEDLNEACGYTPTPSTTKYAYYNSNYVSGKTDGYTNTTHSETCNGYTVPRFYTYDEDGETKTVENVSDYKVPTATSPVKVTYTYYNYDPSTLGTTNSSTVSGILGNNYGWLASTCVNTNLHNVNFYVRRASSSGVGSHALCNSDGTVGSPSNGLRPLLDLSSDIEIEQQSEGVWKIK